MDSGDAANGPHIFWRTAFRVINRANAGSRILAKDADYAAFERVMNGTLAKKPMRILACLFDKPRRRPDTYRWRL